MNPTLIEKLAQTLVADRLRDAAQSKDSPSCLDRGLDPGERLDAASGTPS